MSTLDFAPLKLDLLNVRAGDENRRVIQFLADGVPWDLTGAILSAHAKASVTDTEPALVATIEIIDPLTGMFNLSWNGDEVRTLLGAMPTWKGVWDLQLEQGAEFPTTALEGSFSAVLDVTQ